MNVKAAHKPILSHLWRLWNGLVTAAHYIPSHFGELFWIMIKVSSHLWISYSPNDNLSMRFVEVNYNRASTRPFWAAEINRTKRGRRRYLWPNCHINHVKCRINESTFHLALPPLLSIVLLQNSLVKVCL